MSYTSRRGDLVWLTFDPRAGHEQVGTCSAFVLSPEACNRKTDLLLACPVTSKVKGYPSEVQLPAGLSVDGAILADQIKTLDWKARRAEFARRIGYLVVEAVLALVLPLVGEEG